MTKQIGVDDLAGDLFGLNIRGLYSIATLWARPQRYFEAALSSDWQDRFTPSIRLWLSLIALTSLLQFFWIGTGTPLVGAYADGFRDAGVTLQEGQSYEALGEEAALWIFAVFPIVQLLTFLLIMPLFAFWGQQTTYSLRVRFGFSMMIPSASLMVFLLPAMSLLEPSQVSSFGLAIGVLAFTIDSITVFRGAKPGSTRTGRLLRSGLLAAIALLLNVTMHTLTQITGIVLISIRYGLSTP